MLFILADNSRCQTYSENKIYLVGRGTLSKKKLIGDGFNLKNNNLTHIGIGVFDNNEMMIYNVSVNKSENGSSLIIENLDDFIDINDIFYLGIWYYECNKKQFQEFKSILNNYKMRKIHFDKKFEVKNDNELYCSEFVIEVLNKTNIFNFKPYKKNLKKIIKEFLNIDKLTYYPVDLFLTNNKIKQLYVQEIKKN